VAKPRKPRSRDAEKTRADILKAARLLFSTLGYAQAGLRDIAAKVGVDAALVTRYFGSKKDLFRAALESEPSAAAWLQLPKPGFGAAFVAYFFSKPVVDGDALAMLLRAAGDDEVRKIAVGVVKDRFVRPIAQWLGPPSAQVRATMIFSLLSGLWIYHRLVPLAGLRTRSGALKSAAHVATMLQQLVDGHMP
jgi:AcrR family transcriptional regulator